TSTCVPIRTPRTSSAPTTSTPRTSAGCSPASTRTRTRTTTPRVVPDRRERCAADRPEPGGPEHRLPDTGAPLLALHARGGRGQLRHQAGRLRLSVRIGHAELRAGEDDVLRLRGRV